MINITSHIQANEVAFHTLVWIVLLGVALLWAVHEGKRK